ncbi:hypothetical protein V0R50_03365 [Pseudomonas sp. 148P]|uniref:Uncharacterized protein n=1 Tax=Pseudomonas ulcerans TaxID=3115852 RepID=A0ABU7HL56_9PSED|nr:MULTISPECIES: hypothetical protein [unclassified Pseudomonas]MEE1920849.1 hypothetical protein [Pseudomonas sp. 147P]MEE1932250.1 hypothetical protein [Pseudomonas sp. 148P]
MDDLRKKMEAGEPLMQQAIEALRRYHEAKAAGRPIHETEHLRVLADSLLQAVSEYQLQALGGPMRPFH